MSIWLPIATVPNEDNERRILITDGDDIVIGSVIRGVVGVDFAADVCPDFKMPTHWMDLPLLPKKGRA